MNDAELIGLVTTGHNVLMTYPRYDYAKSEMHHIMQKWHKEAQLTLDGWFIRHKKSGGLMHFVRQDDDRRVAGMEYHASVGRLTPIMGARVRLPVAREGS